MLKLHVEKAPRKPRAKKPASIAPHYTLAPAEPCPFVAVPTPVPVSIPVPVPVQHPVYVAGTVSEINGVAWAVSLFSDDTVKIHVNASRTPVATGRFATSTRRSDYGYNVESQIVDVLPVDAVSAEILQSLTNDLTYFAMRAGRFSGKMG